MVFVAADYFGQIPTPQADRRPSAIQPFDRASNAMASVSEFLVYLLADQQRYALLKLSTASLHISAENFCFAASNSGNNFSKMAGMSIRLVATDKLMAAIV